MSQTFQLLMNDPERGELEIAIDADQTVLLTRRGQTVAITPDEADTLYKVLGKSRGGE